MTKFLSNIDLNNNSIKNIVIDNRDNEPDNPKTGQIYYNNILHKVYVYEDDSWNELSLPNQNGNEGKYLSTNGSELIWENSVNYKHLTNCITAIPQDINLELTDGTLTLKSGSKVYTGTGTAINVNSDIVFHSGTIGSSTDSFFIFCNTSGGFGARATSSQCISSSSNPGSGYYAWFDTTNNKVMYSTSANGTFDTELSLPIGIYQRTSGNATSINQIFNGFGYLDKTIFALPGVEGLIPNGRNSVGTLNNYTYKTNKVIVGTSMETYTGRYTVVGNAADMFLLSGDYTYNYELNINENNGVKSNSCIWGTLDVSSGKITSFNIKKVFKVVDEFELQESISNNNSIVTNFGHIGQIGYTTRTSVPDGCAWCDGSEYTQSAFPNVYQMLVDGDLQKTDYTTYSHIISANGSCGFFGLKEGHSAMYAWEDIGSPKYTESETPNTGDILYNEELKPIGQVISYTNNTIVVGDIVATYAPEVEDTTTYTRASQYDMDATDARFKVPKLSDVYIKAGQTASYFNTESLPNPELDIIIRQDESSSTDASLDAIYGNDGYTGSSLSSTASADEYMKRMSSYGTATYADVLIDNNVYQDGAKVNPDNVVYRAYVVLYSSAVEASVAQAGEFIQGLSEKANARDVQSSLANKASVNADNFTSDGKFSITWFGMPDYSAGVSLSAGNVAPTNGYIYTTLQGTNSTQQFQYINGIEIMRVNSHNQYTGLDVGTLNPITSGESVSMNCVFYPCKGVQNA